MPINIDISILLSYLNSTSNLALSSRDVYNKVTSNGFPIRTIKGDLCPDNFSFYEALNCPYLNEWLSDLIFDAIGRDDSKHLDLLLDCKADIEALNNTSGFTPLMWAAVNRHMESLKLLLKRRANTETKSPYEDTALSWACWANRVDAIEILLENGAQVDPRLRERYLKYSDLWGDSTL